MVARNLRNCRENKFVKQSTFLQQANTLLVVRNRSRSLRIQPQMALVNESMIYRKSDHIIT
jgi:hypothetical protein